MFKNNNLYDMVFKSPNSNFEVKGRTVAFLHSDCGAMIDTQAQLEASEAWADPRAFEIVAPQPPPFVSSVCVE